MSGFACHPLRPDQAPSVYPLVREAIPGIDLKAWLQFARRIADPRKAGREGIMVVTRRPRLLPCGLFVYRREIDLERGPVLVAEHFVAVDVLDAEPVMQALIAELDGLAARLGCGAIRAMVMSPASQLASGLQAAGHRPEGATLWKELSTPAMGSATIPTR
jgi:hypothetical protein